MTCTRCLLNDWLIFLCDHRARGGMPKDKWASSRGEQGRRDTTGTALASPRPTLPFRPPSEAAQPMTVF